MRCSPSPETGSSTWGSRGDLTSLEDQLRGRGSVDLADRARLVVRRLSCDWCVSPALPEESSIPEAAHDGLHEVRKGVFDGMRRLIDADNSEDS